MEPTDEKHLRAMTFLVSLGGIFVIGGTAEAGPDSYLSVMLTLPAVLAIGALYAHLARLGGADGYFGLCRRALGTVGGFLATAVTGMYALFVGSALLGDLTYFVHTVMLPALPKAVVAAAVLLVAAYAVSCGDRAMRWSAPLFTRTILGMLAFTILLSLLAVDYGNFPLPVFADGLGTVLNGSWMVFSMSFCETVILLPLVRSGREKKLRTSGFLRGGAAAVLLLALIFLRNLLALGSETAGRLFFRSFAAVRVVSFGAFFQRLEIFVSLAYLLCDLFELTACIRCIVGAADALSKRPVHRAAVLPVGLILFTGALLFASDEQKITAMIQVDRLAAPAAAILLPLAVWLGMAVKSGKHGKVRRRLD